MRLARTADEAVELLADGDREVKVLAGGQSLVPLMSFRLARPDVLVDINPVAELQSIAVEDGTLRIGAMTRQRAVERSGAVAAGWPLLAAVLPYVAHAPIRNRGTFGGSIAHADPSAELCCASLALDARLVARRAGGEREIAAADFFAGPFMTVLEQDELLTEVAVPAVAPRTGWGFEEVARRRGDFALVGVAAVVTASPGNGSGSEADARVDDVRLAYLSMGSTPTRAVAAEAALRGRPGGTEAFREAAAVAAGELQPYGDIHASPDYRRHLARVLTVRALGAAWARATALAA